MGLRSDRWPPREDHSSAAEEARTEDGAAASRRNASSSAPLPCRRIDQHFPASRYKDTVSLLKTVPLIERNKYILVNSAANHLHRSEQGNNTRNSSRFTACKAIRPWRNASLSEHAPVFLPCRLPAFNLQSVALCVRSSEANTFAALCVLSGNLCPKVAEIGFRTGNRTRRGP